MVRRSEALPHDDEEESEITAALNSVGEEGWELVSAVAGSLEGTYEVKTFIGGKYSDADEQSSGSIKADALLICYYFKRPKQ